MTRLFGTDGIRARAGEYPLDYDSVYGLGRALVSLAEEERLSRRFLIGRDTRESGAWLEAALVHGLEDAGGTADSAGVVPTSAVSLLVKRHDFGAGLVISASHNPYQDNGIKIFSHSGLKISEGWERRLEKGLHGVRASARPRTNSVTPQPALAEEYLGFLKSRAPEPPSAKPFKVVLDCANGAASDLAPRLLRDLGLDVEAMGNEPDGKNINQGCGSLHPQRLAQSVVERGADIGIAYDGDADRAVWVDEKGRVLDGDHTLYIQAAALHRQGRLRPNVVVATTMSNLGLEKALETMGIRLVRTAVGDRFVLERMMALGASLGGEQSGHTIFLDDLPTGDGILTSLKMLGVLWERDCRLSELARGFIDYPQTLLNVRVSRKADFAGFPEITDTMALIRETLRNAGRLEVRYSGTEPLARVMVEGPDRRQVEQLARRMADVILKHLGD